jgi:hypothetical protein
MDVYPQLFDRQKTLILEPLVGHSGLSGQDSGQMPRAFAADYHEDGRLEIRAQFQESVVLWRRARRLSLPLSHFELRRDKIMPRTILTTQRNSCTSYLWI